MNCYGSVYSYFFVQLYSSTYSHVGFPADFNGSLNSDERNEPRTICSRCWSA